MRRRIAALALAAAASVAIQGCAVNYDRTGTWRRGIFLWGLGDPPGVDWNLDWPRRPLPELPPATYPELPARSPPWWRDSFLAPAGDPPPAARPAAAIDDNPGCGTASHSPPCASRVDPRTPARRGADGRG
jgi:hypothetical protein